MAPAALIETWALYAGASLVILLRIISRTKVVGFKGYHADDYLIFVAWGAYTSMTVAAHIVGGTGDTSHLTQEQREMMTPQQRESRSLGSKWFMVGWYTYILLIWTLKFNMLCLYRRVVKGLFVEKFILPAMGFVVVSAVTIFIILSAACRPFHQLWQVLPDPGPRCTPQSSVFLITILTFNLLTDLIILIIPIPVILPIKTTVPRKVGLYFLFSLGIFVMVAAILRVVFVVALQKGETAAIWSCREDFVAILVGQATMIRQMFGRKFWQGGYARSTGRTRGTSAMKLSSLRKQPSSGGSKSHDPYRITNIESDSTEEIARTKSDFSGGDQSRKEMQVTVETTFNVEEMDPGEGPPQADYYAYGSQYHPNTRGGTRPF